MSDTKLRIIFSYLTQQFNSFLLLVSDNINYIFCHFAYFGRDKTERGSEKLTAFPRGQSDKGLRHGNK